MSGVQVGDIYQNFECRGEVQGGKVQNIVRWSVSGFTVSAPTCSRGCSPSASVPPMIVAYGAGGRGSDADSWSFLPSEQRAQHRLVVRECLNRGPAHQWGSGGAHCAPCAASRPAATGNPTIPATSATPGSTQDTICRVPWVRV